MSTNFASDFNEEKDHNPALLPTASEAIEKYLEAEQAAQYFRDAATDLLNSSSIPGDTPLSEAKDWIEAQNRANAAVRRLHDLRKNPDVQAYLEDREAKYGIQLYQDRIDALAHDFEMVLNRYPHDNEVMVFTAPPGKTLDMAQMKLQFVNGKNTLDNMAFSGEDVDQGNIYLTINDDGWRRIFRYRFKPNTAEILPAEILEHQLSYNGEKFNMDLDQFLVAQANVSGLDESDLLEGYSNVSVADAEFPTDKEIN